MSRHHNSALTCVLTWLAACAGLLAVATASSSAACGAAGQPPCTSGDPCQAGTVEFSNVCRLCGEASQPACTGAGVEPCDAGLLTAEVDGVPLCVPVPCGEAGQQTCPSGEPCVTGTTVFSSFCRLCGGASQPPCSSGAACAAGFMASGAGEEATCMPTLCGSAGQPPCESGEICEAGTSVFGNVCRLCGGPSQPICSEEEPCSAGLQSVVIDGDSFCLPVPCGEAGQFTCPTGEACVAGTSVFGSFCRLCGGPAQPICTSGDPCDAGLAAAPQSDANAEPLCFPGDAACGAAGQPPCATGEACAAGTTEFDNVCRLCGEASQPVCAVGNACTGSLVSVVVGGDALCALLPCGEAGQQTCPTGAPCVEGTTVFETFCRLCGGVSQPVCDSDEPCEPGLLEETSDGVVFCVDADDFAPSGGYGRKY